MWRCFDEPHARIRCTCRRATTCVVRWPGASGASQPASACTPKTRTSGRSTGFAALLRDAGFQTLQHWTDEQRWFALFLASG
jgi:uncharacterized SAM-dependent methyltransferase